MAILRLILLLLCWQLIRADEPAPPAPIVPVQMNYVDSETFDQRLAMELKKQPAQLEINIIGKISVNDLPTRLDKWISKAAEHNGMRMEVWQEPLQTKSLGLVLSVIGFIFEKGSSFLSDYAMRRALERASAYSVVLYYQNQADGEVLIRRIALHREAAKEE